MLVRVGHGRKPGWGEGTGLAAHGYGLVFAVTTRLWVQIVALVHTTAKEQNH